MQCMTEGGSHFFRGFRTSQGLGSPDTAAKDISVLSESVRLLGQHCCWSSLDSHWVGCGERLKSGTCYSFLSFVAYVEAIEHRFALFVTALRVFDWERDPRFKDWSATVAWCGWKWLQGFAQHAGSRSDVRQKDQSLMPSSTKLR